ncbi:hypothetical protein [Ferrovibrio xuzhouensis]|uniref:Uncharacterized protein n=1 Tax=Ferrovibrio xuzhouensis TaxID=1576914 RepID=A0ABV7VCV3_9PROT
MSQKPPASPACSLDEAPDSYRGYLAPAEIAAVLRAMAAGAPAEIAARLDGLCNGLPAPAAQLPSGFTGDAAADLDRLLPRIRDDALHAALRALRDMNP